MTFVHCSTERGDIGCKTIIPNVDWKSTIDIL